MGLNTGSTKKRFILDIGLSSIAYSLPVVALYFFVQPGMAGRLGGPEYGIALTLFTLTQFFDSTFIMSIGNVRLLRSSEDETDADSRFFLISLLITVCVVSLGALAVIEALFGIFAFVKYSLMSVSFVAMAFFDYCAIEYRVQLNYRRIVASNFFLVTGFGIGYVLFVCTGLWELIYIAGYVLGGLYVLITIRPWKCKKEIHNVRSLLKQYFHYVGSNITTSLVAYGDRIILFPMLGAFSVSLYASAAVASKVINFITVPLGNVMLSYLVKIESLSMSIKTAWKVLAILLLAMAVTCIAFLPVSRFLTSFLYPQWCDDSLQYIPIIISAVCVSCYGNLLNTVALRFIQSSFQLKVSCVRLITYLVSAITLTHLFGLYGFCFGLLIAESARFLMLAASLLLKISREEHKKVTHDGACL